MKGKIKQGGERQAPSLYGDAIQPFFMFVHFLATDEQTKKKQKHETTMGYVTRNQYYHSYIIRRDRIPFTHFYHFKQISPGTKQTPPKSFLESKETHVYHYIFLTFSPSFSSSLSLEENKDTNEIRVMVT